MLLNSNITETAVWTLQYYVNATTNFGNVSGSGWYSRNSTATLRVNSANVSTGTGKREVFQGWSTGGKTLVYTSISPSPLQRT